MSLADIRTAIKTVIETVADIGVVTDFEPLTTRREDFLTYFKAASLAYVQGWTIMRESSAEVKANQERLNRRTHVMVIRGYRAIDTAAASEKAFQDLAEVVCDTLRAKELDQLDGKAYLTGAPAVRLFEPRKYSDYLVHYVEIVYPVTAVVTF